MSAPCAQQIISSMKIIMGEDGTSEGKFLKSQNYDVAIGVRGGGGAGAPPPSLVRTTTYSGNFKFYLGN